MLCSIIYSNPYHYLSAGPETEFDNDDGILADQIDDDEAMAEEADGEWGTGEGGLDLSGVPEHILPYKRRGNGRKGVSFVVRLMVMRMMSEDISANVCAKNYRSFLDSLHGADGSMSF